MGSKVNWTVGGTYGQVFSFKGEKLFYVTMVNGWHDQIVPTCQRLVEALNASEKSVELVCDNMTGEARCDAVVTHIDEKGYVYCSNCGQTRKESGRKCRKLRPADLRQLRTGQPLTHY